MWKCGVSHGKELCVLVGSPLIVVRLGPNVEDQGK